MVPGPGIEPAPSAVEARILNHWTVREVPVFYFLKAEPGDLGIAVTPDDNAYSSRTASAPQSCTLDILIHLILVQHHGGVLVPFRSGNWGAERNDLAKVTPVLRIRVGSEPRQPGRI